MTGLKYEQNPAAKKVIQDKVKGYLQRAEDIKKALSDTAASNNGKSGGSKTLSKDDAKKEKEDDEKAKMRGTLASAIVSEKPNVKWDDVAGLEGAKEALKEGLEIALSSICCNLDDFLFNSCHLAYEVSATLYW